MDAEPAGRVLRSLRSITPVAALAGSVGAALLAPLQREAAGKKRRNECHRKNWCIDRTHTCGFIGGHSKCVVKAFGGNICAEILFQVESCDACDPPNCRDCVCALAAGGGDHCNNGLGSHNDFICVKA